MVQITQEEEIYGAEDHQDVKEFNMKWDYVEQLDSEQLIFEYEKKVSYKFPKEFIQVIISFNAGYPEYTIFYSYRGKKKYKRVFNYLYSFNKGDKDCIWEYNDWNGYMRGWNKDGQMVKYVAFAGDPFGNLICFDKTDDKIVFIDHETLEIEDVADNFSDFINNLRKK